MLFAKSIKLFLIILFIFICSSSLFALNSGNVVLSPGVGVGVVLGDSTTYPGAELSQITGDNTAWQDGKTEISTGAVFGAGLDYLITNHLALSTGLYYEYLPYKAVWPAGTYRYDYSVMMNFYYLTMPVGIRCYLGYIMVGGGVYFSLSTSIDSHRSIGPFKDNSYLGKSNTMGFYVDAGLNFDVAGNNLLLIFVKYRHDLNNAYSVESNGNLINDVELKTITLHLACGIII